MRFGISAACAAIIIGWGSTTHAAGTFQCQFEQMASNMGWIEPVIALTHAKGAQTAAVSDGVILNYIGAPAQANVATDNAKRTTYVWNLTTQDNAGQNGKLVFRLTLMKADLSARIKVIPQGYINSFDAGGTCTEIATP